MKYNCFTPATTMRDCRDSEKVVINVNREDESLINDYVQSLLNHQRMLGLVRRTELMIIVLAIAFSAIAKFGLLKALVPVTVITSVAVGNGVATPLIMVMAFIAIILTPLVIGNAIRIPLVRGPMTVHAVDYKNTNQERHCKHCCDSRWKTDTTLPETLIMEDSLKSVVICSQCMQCYKNKYSCSNNATEQS